MGAVDDLELHDRWCAGDRAAGNELFERHFESLYRFFEHKVDGEVDDLVQDTFLACVGGRAGYRRQSSFRTYLFAIARHLLYDHWSQRVRVKATADLAEESIASLTSSVRTKMGRQQDHARLVRALRTLPLDLQLLLELHYWENLDGIQLAEVFGTAPATSRSRLFRARAALRESLENLPADAPTAPEGQDPCGARLLADLAVPAEGIEA